MVFVPSGGFSRSGWSKSARFNMLLDEKTSAHVDGEVHPTVNQKIEDYTRGIKIPPEGENLLIQNGKYIYAYYDKKEHMLVLIGF